MACATAANHGMARRCLWQVFNNKDHAENLYGEAVEVDYRGYEVTVENFLRVLTGVWQATVRSSAAAVPLYTMPVESATASFSRQLMQHATGA